MPPNKGKILIIEDDPMQVMMYRAVLEKYGFEVHAARNKKEGIKQITKVKPDLIFLDLILGLESGLDILRKVKGGTRKNKLRIIILTNYFKKGLNEECLKLGAEEFLLKTYFMPNQIAEKAKKYIRPSD